MKKILSAFCSLLSVLSFILSSLLLTTSCERRPLETEFDEGNYCDILLLTDWKLLSETPTGITAMFFPEDGGTPTVLMSNNTVGNVIRLRQGQYKVLVFNQSIYEFGTMTFSDIESFDLINARLVGLAEAVNQETLSDYNWIYSAIHGNPDSLSMVVRNPEALNSDRFSYQVTEEMCKKQYQYEQEVAEDPWGTRKTQYVDTIRSTPPPVAPTMHVTVNVKGINNAYKVRAYISNMARADLLGPHRNKSEVAIHVISNWTINPNAADKTTGTVKASFRTFGTPSMQVTQTDIYQTWGDTRNAQQATRDGVTIESAGNNHLYLEFMLKDGETVVAHDFDVSEDIKYAEDQLLLNVELNVETSLPDVPDKMGAGGAGFDADVENWKNEDKDIIF